MTFEDYKAARLAHKAAVAMRPDVSRRHSTLESHHPKKVLVNGMLYDVRMYQGNLMWRCQLIGSASEIMVHESEWTIVEGCQCQKCWKKANRNQ